ncbi:MAG: C40 family peptidase [Chitinophagales bacterium]|nr:C40 family peptidase [Chitinophagales bacterium]
MEYGICNLSLVPVRAEPSDRSEMTTQLLFGEIFAIQQRQQSWLKIRIAHDGYEGWIDEKQYLSIPVDYYQQILNNEPHIALDIMQAAVSPARHVLVLAGSNLPAFDGMNFKLFKEKFVYNGQAIDAYHDRNLDRFIERCALKYLHAPYLWGGRSPFGIDCSGFTQVVFKMLGISIKRDAYQQAEEGFDIDFAGQAAEGDLAFFGNDDRITHVGIVMNDGKIIHASGRVRIDLLDHFGIYNQELKKYTHKLKVIKRLL